MKNLNVKISDRVVVYENKGTLWSSRVYWMFRVYGHQNVSILNGGYHKWVSEGFPTEEKDKYVAEAEYDYTFDPLLYRDL